MGQKIEVEIEQLGISDVARQRDRLVEQEAYLRATLADASPDERELMMAVVRATLIRLASDDSWMPGAVAIKKGRIDMHITVDLTDIDTLIHMGQVSLVEAAGMMRVRLVELAARLENMAP